MRAAFYESDITAPLGCHQAGYFTRRVAIEVHNKIYSKALVVEDNGKYAVIGTYDGRCIFYDTEVNDYLV